VGLFAGFALTQGIGRADVPDDAVAVVEEAPDSEIGTITREEFDRALDQAAARAGMRQVPEEGSRQYADVAQAALGDLLDTVWIQSEAADQGISVSERQIEDQLQQIKDQNFRNDREFQRFLEESGFTDEDVNLRVELQILSTRLQQAVNEGAPGVTPEDVEDFYEATKEQYELPETRDVRLILNSDRAKVEQAKEQLEEDSSPAAWRRIARELSTDPASRNSGGRRPGLTEGLLEEPLNSEIFDAEEGEIAGPLRTPLGFYVFQVEKITPARTQELSELRRQIRSQLAQQQEQSNFTNFITDYGSKWGSRTVCAEELFDLPAPQGGPGSVERCANFAGSGRPQGAPAACYAESPRGGRPDACPAAVAQLMPALPGTVSAIAPLGQQLPQRPRPAGLAPPNQQPLPGALPGVPPGVAP
jgi:parvulin-like peptidyl-prolyl isomerase